MLSNKMNFLEKVGAFNKITSIEEKCEYVYVLLKDIIHVEDGHVIYSEEHDNYQFFSRSGYCTMRLVMSPYGSFEHFELTCN
ncbi:hypothetical protein R7W29_000635 [Citrobacter freundii]|uniref:hypothetical protein n=1 Tax=Enterobacteriaceae TaxID=543 RepID=UPI000DF1861D|nr:MULTISPECIES: hypothetical protein [Enterobacteriaceae]ELY4804906.1 hypothetical protein [Cronobacter malonaticus]QFH69559.1 hypothetical protein FR762_07330 [Enterobacter sp. E76]AXF63319.1 hypothetical protein DVA44_03790 [Leclercia sp. W17]ELT0891261.1 hypothetical protein [Citrobacter freundii]MBG2618575.1 hypothetical protein [Klebsiella michiganensis]